jgi:uncharacterized protein (TIGR00255 family)
MHSMTGFGRGEAIADGIVWRAEASSVNRKQLELVVSLPRELSELEIPIRNRCAARLSRGRVQVSISMDEGAGSASRLRVDETLAQQYAEALQHLAQKLHISPTLSLTEMTRWPGVFSIEQTSWIAEQALPHLEKAVDAALTQMLAMRQAEGLNLKTDISGRLDALQIMLRDARALAPQIIERQRDMLRQRLADAGLPLPLDDERLVKEIALFADRSDTTEEQTRAESHIAQFRTYMDSGEPVGRSLDFLSQELFREFNTMGSKANHAQLAQLVVRAKTELEKIREQVQNVE